MSVFGLEHILYMVITLFVMISSIIIIKKFVPQQKMYLVVKIIAIIGLIMIIINRIVVSKSRDANFLDFLPDTYCSMMGFILPIVVLLFKPNTKIFQYAMFAGMIGGLLTFIYPDFLVYFDNIFNIHPFTGLLYHTIMLYLFMVSIATKYFVPTFKNWTSLPIGLAFMVVAGVFGNNVLGQNNNMYLNAPLISGTPLTWWLVGLLILVLYTIILTVYEMVTLQKNEWFWTKLFRINNRTKNVINDDNNGKTTNTVQNDNNSNNKTDIANKNDKKSNKNKPIKH